MKIAVFCAARDSLQQRHKDDAAFVGRNIARRGHSLVFGGGNCGLMGEVSRAAKEAGAHVYGVTIRGLAEIEPPGNNCSQLDIVELMSVRKDMICDASDAFIVLPGGVGTMEEFFQVLCHNQIAVYDKPIVLVNTNGFYDPLITFMQSCIKQKAMGKSIFEHFTIVGDAWDAVRTIEELYEEQQDGK